MYRLLKRVRAHLLLLGAALILLSLPANAGEIILSNNSGADSAWFGIEDEPSLVINGFDLGPYALAYPTALDAVSISVNRATGAPMDLVIYQDANGGSPVDATLVYRQQVTINRTGFIRIILDQAAIISEPVIWVGFYMPVGFRFNADQSGSSVLTYWAWTPGGSFDISDLSSAVTLGPGDGTDPVNISMGGIARITAEIRDPFFEEMSSEVLVGRQFVDEDQTDTAILVEYENCGDLLYDPEDINISGKSSFSIDCSVKQEFDAPTNVAQPSGEILDVQRAGHLYKLEPSISQDEYVHGAVNTFPVPVTHCMRIQPIDLERAIVAEARDIPERWFVLPSVRFGDIVCAEITHGSYLAYFLPRTDSSPQNVNLVLGWARTNPHPMQCGRLTYFSIPLVNTGQNWFDTPTSDVKIIIEDIHVQSGQVQGALEHKVPTSQLGPGMRNLLEIGPLIIDQHVHELHRLQVRIDFDERVEETNEFDNMWFTEYVLANAGGSNRCYDRAWHTATPLPNTSLDYCFVGQPERRGEDKIQIPISPACNVDFESGHVEMPSEGREPQRLFKIRECDLGIRIHVEGQDVLVRYRNFSDQCGGGFDHSIDEERDVLIIDHDY